MSCAARCQSLVEALVDCAQPQSVNCSVPKWWSWRRGTACLATTSCTCGLLSFRICELSVQRNSLENSVLVLLITLVSHSLNQCARVHQRKCVCMKKGSNMLSQVFYRTKFYSQNVQINTLMLYNQLSPVVTTANFQHQFVVAYSTASVILAPKSSAQYHSEPQTSLGSIMLIGFLTLLTKYYNYLSLLRKL